MRSLFLSLITLSTPISLVFAESNLQAERVATLEQYLKDYQTTPPDGIPPKPFDMKKIEMWDSMQAALKDKNIPGVLKIISDAEINIFKDKTAPYGSIVKLKNLLSKLQTATSQDEANGLAVDAKATLSTIASTISVQFEEFSKGQKQYVDSQTEKIIATRNKQMLQRALKNIKENLPEDSEDQPEAVRRVLLNQKTGKTYEFVFVIPSHESLQQVSAKN